MRVSIVSVPFIGVVVGWLFVAVQVMIQSVKDRIP